MGRKLPPREAELYKRCDEVLHYVWDPVGVAGVPGARDEYNAYLPQVFSRLRDEVEPARIVEYLTSVEVEGMGLAPNRERAKAVVEQLIEWREWIWEHAV